MSEKPRQHPMMRISEGHYTHVEVIVPDGVFKGKVLRELTPDEAVALGYALFEHGLYLKGRMRNSNEHRPEIAGEAGRDQADANGQRGNGDEGKDERGDDKRVLHGETPEK